MLNLNGRDRKIMHYFNWPTFDFFLYFVFQNNDDDVDI